MKKMCESLIDVAISFVMFAAIIVVALWILSKAPAPVVCTCTMNQEDTVKK